MESKVPFSYKDRNLVLTEAQNKTETRSDFQIVRKNTLPLRSLENVQPIKSATEVVPLRKEDVPRPIEDANFNSKTEYSVETVKPSLPKKEGKDSDIKNQNKLESNSAINLSFNKETNKLTFTLPKTSVHLSRLMSLLPDGPYKITYGLENIEVELKMPQNVAPVLNGSKANSTTDLEKKACSTQTNMEQDLQTGREQELEDRLFKKLEGQLQRKVASRFKRHLKKEEKEFKELEAHLAKNFSKFEDGKLNELEDGDLSEVETRKLNELDDRITALLDLQNQVAQEMEKKKKRFEERKAKESANQNHLFTNAREMLQGNNLIQKTCIEDRRVVRYFYEPYQPPNKFTFPARVIRERKDDLILGKILHNKIRLDFDQLVEELSSQPASQFLVIQERPNVPLLPWV